MREILAFAFSSIGKKLLMALTGAALCGFIVVHLMGNCFLFVGEEAFNTYSYLLTSKKLFLYAAEAGLVLLFLFHLVLALQVTVENFLARPIGYSSVKSRKDASRRNLASITMPYTGLVIIAFVIFHVLTMKYGLYYEKTYNGIVMRDIYKLVIEFFTDPYYAFGYVFVMIILGFHLYHACASAVQTFGFYHDRVKRAILIIGKVFAIIVAAGFSIFPLWIYFRGGM